MFTRESEFQHRVEEESNGTYLCQVGVTVQEIRKEMERLHARKAQGPDGVSNRRHLKLGENGKPEARLT